MMVWNMPTLRKRKYRFLVEALHGVNEDTIIRSWDATGIPRALWGDVPSAKPVIDVVKEQAGEENESECECGAATA